MLTNKQQEIVDSLVNEFTKMNQPKNVTKKGLLDWDEIYSEIDAWENTKAEITLKDEAFLKNAELEVERITEMLEGEFNNHFYIYQPTTNDIKSGWRWNIIPYGNDSHKSILSINMDYHKFQVNNKSNTKHTYSIEELYFYHSLDTSMYFKTIETIFKDKSVINRFKSHLNE